MAAGACSRRWARRAARVPRARLVPRIYNENLLLADGDAPAARRPRDPRRGVFVEANEVIPSQQKILELLAHGQRRSVGATAMNSARAARTPSSRSSSRAGASRDRRGPAEGAAGRRRARREPQPRRPRGLGERQVHARDGPAREGGRQDQPVAAGVSRVIQQLAARGAGDAAAANAVVSFSDSKLTRILQPMLLGNAHGDGVLRHAEQVRRRVTLGLQFAHRAAQVR